MAGYIGTQAVSVNTTSATISDDLAVGDDLTVTDDAAIGGTLGVTGKITADAGIDIDNFNIDGTSISLSSGSMTINAADVRIKNVANNETMLQCDDDGAVNLFNNNDICLSTATSGAVTIVNGLSLLNGNLTVAAGHGVVFGVDGTGDGADTSELLDDYEEGTWTAVVAGVDGGTRTMGSNNKAYYTKVGRSVTVTGTLHVNGSETLSGFVKITGIPYASDNASNHRAAGSVSANQLFNTGASGTRLGIGIDPGNAFIFVLKVNDSTPNYAHIVNADVGANHNLYGFTLTYNA